jgi:type IX secretion system PorP/SprF family membrane protein
MRMISLAAVLHITLAGLVSAQQAPQFSLHMLNPFLYQPAAAGIDNSLLLSGSYRNQWIGLPGSPVSLNLSAQMPLLGNGIGLQVEKESIGSWEQTSASAAYALHTRTSKTGTLSFGIRAGFLQQQLDGSSVRTPGTEFLDEGTPATHNDPLLSVAVESGSSYTLQAGILYRNNRFTTGFSAINLLENTVRSNTLTFTTKRTGFLTVGYRMPIGRKWDFTPSALLKTDLTQLQLDLSAMLQYRENIFAGASFRGYSSNSIDALALFAGAKVNEKLSAAIAFDLGLSSLRQTHDGSLELNLNYSLGKTFGQGRPPNIIYNPRSL